MIFKANFLKFFQYKWFTHIFKDILVQTQSVTEIPLFDIDLELCQKLLCFCLQFGSGNLEIRAIAIGPLDQFPVYCLLIQRQKPSIEYNYQLIQRTPTHLGSQHICSASQLSFTVFRTRHCLDGIWQYLNNVQMLPGLRLDLIHWQKLLAWPYSVYERLLPYCVIKLP